MVHVLAEIRSLEVTLPFVHAHLQAQLTHQIKEVPSDMGFVSIR